MTAPILSAPILAAPILAAPILSDREYPPRPIVGIGVES